MPENIVRFGGGHCCVCSGVCGHIGGPWYCAQHERMFAAPAAPYVAPVLTDRTDLPHRPGVITLREHDDAMAALRAENADLRAALAAGSPEPGDEAATTDEPTGCTCAGSCEASGPSRFPYTPGQ